MSNTPGIPSALDNLLPAKTIQVGGVEQSFPTVLNFDDAGSSMTKNDDGTNTLHLFTTKSFRLATPDDATAIVAGKAVMPINGAATLVTMAALGVALSFAGIALADPSNGRVTVVMQGIIEPSIVNLNDGVACAVGTDASGNPVRVTDPTCVSGRKLLGVCDVNGAIYVSVRNVVRMSLEDFGAVGDGSDDSTAIQAAIAFAVKFNIPLDAGSFNYGVGTELLVPPTTSGHVGFELRGQNWGTGASGSGADRTSFVALGGSMRSILSLARPLCDVSGIKFDAAGISQYAMHFQGATLSNLNKVLVVGAVVDGFHLSEEDDTPAHCNNDSIAFNDCVAQGNGIVRATNGCIANYSGMGQAVVSIAGTVATNGTYVLTFSGAPDLTTLGIRIGDVIRIGAAHDDTTQYYQVGAVHDATTLYIGGTRIPGTASDLDFAITIGDGYHEEQSNDNNVMKVRGGAYQLNAGYGLLFAGFYGPEISGAVLAQVNGAFGIGVGYGGGDGGATPADVLQAAFVRPYFEANVGGSMLIGKGQGVDVIQAQLEAPFGIVADPTFASGYWSDTSGIHAFGIDGGYQSNLYALRAHNLAGIGTLSYSEQIPDIPTAATEIDATAFIRSFTLSGGDQTLTSTPSIAAGVSGQLMLLFNVSGTHTLTLQRDSHLSGTKLKLTADTVDIAPHQSMLLMYTVWDGGGFWVQAGNVVEAA
jgi:hypothetical protein